MKWKKIGHIYKPTTNVSWHAHSALTPTPYLINPSTIRVFAGFRDKEGISRIGFVDLDANNPTIIKHSSSQPVLDIGRPGCFDDNGVILGDVVEVNGKLRMYYIGFQQVKQVKFLAFTGVAESDDRGESFQRISEAPVMDRANEGCMIRAIHSIMYEEGRWRIWYAAGNDWQVINASPFPKYTIWYTESSDGLTIFQPGIQCVDVQNDEYRIGRPSVYKKNSQYYMFYTKGSTGGSDYFPGLATSDDGITWQRSDEQFGLTLSTDGFDSLHLCYPRLIEVNDRVYCIYNGNNMGLEGFGLAELIEW